MHTKTGKKRHKNRDLGEEKDLSDWYRKNRSDIVYLSKKEQWTEDAVQDQGRQSWGLLQQRSDTIVGGIAGWHAYPEWSYEKDLGKGKKSTT